MNTPITKIIPLTLLFLASLLCAAGAGAEVLRLSEVPSHTLCCDAEYFIEGGAPLSLTEAMERQRAGGFKQELKGAPNFGIGSKPVWLHLAFDNDTHAEAERYFVGGVTWLDRMDVYLVRADGSQSAVHTGDELPDAPGLTPAMGYALLLQFSAGRNDLYLRVASTDPMAIPVELMTRQQFEQRHLQLGYFYGFFFGFLAALSAYNFLLVVGTRERSYLYYSLALSSILFCNFAYTGHGVAWLWPEHPGFQKFVILVSMVVYNVLGLMFAARFLALKKHSPRTLRGIRWIGTLAVVIMALALMVDSQFVAAMVAFVCTTAFTIGMFLLGILSVLRNQTSGRYFLFATFFGMLGVGVTALAVWGKIPFRPYTFHAAEFGLVIEATLLALGLSNWMRENRDALYEAEQVARLDALTHLNNRRAFMELALPYASTAGRHERPMSLVMMDIDHFKSINDQYGHQTGDLVLTAVADLLKNFSRTSDIVARWGGEEFILLLPETGLKQAINHAERLRQAIAEFRIPVGETSISLTASFGIAAHVANLSFDKMIEQADVQLYEAKRSGRNKVCCSSAV
ncbi:diguanylate cyclase [Sideroxydans lithotrophicus]|uniref:diguanylate cyclase n=1 Tax=Sideroxydans lithotrophicus (strain ES-1) TaxID=580332 RepID=D5CS57_SIDLE|nr:diguanylate cyclase [Sideroxydans lithotrophicus]ADE11793.1 periplasmic/7TM domain sensor diguanylate cyclase [Sideroxydans lithotrophicus ES-1]